MEEAQQLPQVTFSTFVMSLASAALVQLGEVPDPQTGAASKFDSILARHSIDVLEMLRQKTKNNLDSNEEQLLESILYDLKMKYVLNCEKNPDCHCTK